MLRSNSNIVVTSWFRVHDQTTLKNFQHNAGDHEEKNYGQSKGNKQGNKETTHQNSKREESCQAGQEAQLGQHTDYRALSIHKLRPAEALLHVELENSSDLVFDNNLKMPVPGWLSRTNRPFPVNPSIQGHQLSLTNLVTPLHQHV